MNGARVARRNCRRCSSPGSATCFSATTGSASRSCAAGEPRVPARRDGQGLRHSRLRSRVQPGRRRGPHDPRRRHRARRARRARSTPSSPSCRRPDDGDAPQSLATHGMDPVKVLRMAQTLGGTLGRVILVGLRAGDVRARERRTHGPERTGRGGGGRGSTESIEELVESTEVPWSARNLTQRETTQHGTCCSCSAARPGAARRRPDHLEPSGAALLGDIDINGLAQGALPDIERYMKLRSM